MQPSELSEELAVCNNGTLEIRQVVSICNVQRQLQEGFTADAERPVEMPIRGCRFSSVWFIAINEKYLPCGSSMPGASIGVLLHAFLDEAHDEMLVCMTYESVLHIMRMNDLCAIWRAEAINSNPFGRCPHSEFLAKPLCHCYGSIF
jgi:hypothetical protein